ncbi:MAG: ribosomal protein S18-alanine N-acetyltransferase [Gammaproteobacteria bacterium]|nr:ribosomal protein S18-alanine N-acetyltransferase [Gammaproteobacteria bacterium]
MSAAREDLLPVPAVAIRPMREADLVHVARIEHESYRFPWTEGIFHDCLRVGYTCLVAEIDHLLVGYGVLSAGAGEAHLLNVCVLERVRCRGLGRRLLLELLARARASAADVVFLEARPSNTAAIRLYQALGFVQIGVRRGYYQAAGGREDAIVLRLTLNDAEAR